MTEQERIETLLTALERAIYYGLVMGGYANIWDDFERYKDAVDHWGDLQAIAKHEREKQGTIEEKESVGE